MWMTRMSFHSFILAISIAPLQVQYYSEVHNPRAAYLAAGKIAASRQPGRKKYAAKPPPNIRLKADLPREFNKKLAFTA